VAESDITDLERRTLAHLGQPRTAADLAARMAADENIETRDAEEVEDHLGDLVDRGWVVVLGRFEDAESVGKAVGKTKGAIEFPADQREAYETRLAQPRSAWRFDGDFYFLSREGLEILKGDDE